MSWFDAVPKTELHVHLEGAIPHAALFDLIQKYGGDRSVPDVTALAKRFEYRDFPQFIQSWSWKNQFLREYEDFSHIAELVDHRIPVEMCPVSNVRTNVVASLRDHPIRQYFEAGVIVTVNTDDPKMFQTSLADEYRLLEQKYGWTKLEICRLILAAIHSSWLSADRKTSLAAEFRKDPSWKEA